MSVEFELTPTRLDWKGWNAVLADWNDSSDSELYDPPELEDCGDGEFAAHLMGEGSTRGVSLQLELKAKTFRVRLNALASRADWRMAYQILKAGQKAGGGSVEREDGTVYDAAMLNDRQAESDAVEDFCSSASSVAATSRGAGPVRLPIGGLSITVSAEELQNCTPERQAEIEEALAARIDVYASAYKASIMELQGGITLSTWALIPTVVQKVQAVMIDYNDIVVPLEAVKDVLGDRCEQLGECLYLPELDRTADKKLLDALAAKAIDLGSPDGTEEPGGEGDPLTEEEEADANGTMLYLSAKSICGCILRGEDVQAERALLIENGFDEQLVNGAADCSVMILEDLIQDRRSPEQATANLVESGVPKEIAEILVMGVCKALEERGGGEA